MRILLLAFVFVTAVTPAVADELLGWVNTMPAEAGPRAGVSCQGSCWKDPRVQNWVCPAYQGRRYCVIYCGADPTDNVFKYGCALESAFEPGYLK